MSLRPRAGLVAVVVALGLLGGALAPQVAAALSFSARSSVTPSGSQFVGDSVGTTFALSVENSGTVQTIGAVRITRPTSFWSIVDCPSAPATWSTAMAPDSCTYLSPAGSAGNIAKKHAATFTFVATTAPAIANRTGSWNVTVSTADNFSNPSLTKQSGATGRGLATTAYSFEITDAVVAGSAAGIGDPCPAPNRQGPAGATGEIIIVCGTNHTNVAQKPKKAYSSLSGSFIAGHGAFSGGNVAAGATNVVLGNWSNVSLGGGLGSGHSLQARIGAYAGRLSPQTTLTGYNLSEVAPVASDDDYFTVDEDNLLIGSTVLYNDTDANGDSLNAVLDTGPSHDSSFTLSADGTFSYMPAANYNGTDTFTYHANDGTLDSNTATVTITVNPVDDAPVAVDDSGADVHDQRGLHADRCCAGLPGQRHGRQKAIL